MCAACALGGLEEARNEMEHMLRLQGLFCEVPRYVVFIMRGAAKYQRADPRFLRTVYNPKLGYNADGRRGQEASCRRERASQRETATCAEAEPTEFTRGSGTGPQAPRGLHWP